MPTPGAVTVFAPVPHLRSLTPLALVLLTAACIEATPNGVLPRRSPRPRPTTGDSLVIGLVGTLSGPGLFAAEDAIEGADHAIHEINRGAGEGARFELVGLDDRGDPARARELVADLASSERTVGIVYAGPPQALPETEPVLAAAGIPAVLIYGDLYGARLLEPHLFQVSPPFIWQARKLVRYLLQDRGYRRIGVLAETSPTGRTALAALREALDEIGGRPPAAARYRGSAGLRGSLARLRRRRVEAIVVEGSPEVLARVTRVLAERGSGYRSTAAARIASAPPEIRSARVAAGQWRPQVAGFDLAIGPREENVSLPAGTVAAESYARGAHYLPVPSFERFRSTFTAWWDSPPLGLERRAYDAARMLAWAAERAGGEDDLARVLEGLRERRFGGLDITLGPDDHTSVEPVSVGLWAIPRADVPVPERDRLPATMPWVPLARGFSIDGERTTIDNQDWRHLFRRPPPPRAPAPPFRRMRFGIRTSRADPIH